MYYDDYHYEDSFDQFGYSERQQPGFPTPPTMEGAQPMSAPPAFTPPIPAWQVGPSGIRSCLFRNTFIWLTNGDNFWFFPTFVGRQSLIGFRWRGFGWIYHVIDLRRIRSFQCF